MHRRQQPKEQFYINDTMDPRDVDPRVMWDHSYEALPPSPVSPWSTVVPMPPRPSLAQPVLSSDVINMDEGHCITNALQVHAVALYQMTLTQGVVDPSDQRSLKALTSPGEMSQTHPSSLFSRSNSRSACMLAPTFIVNPEHVDAAASQL